MIAYYLVSAEQVEEVRLCSPVQGLPQELFVVRYNNDFTKAIVRANWVKQPPGIYLGKFLGDQAEQAVYDEIEKPEWQYSME